MMTPDHERWDEFIQRLSGPDGCDFQRDPFTFKCAGGMDKTFATKILEDMGFASGEVAASLTYFEEHGGYCDCEIIFNVDPS